MSEVKEKVLEEFKVDLNEGLVYELLDVSNLSAEENTANIAKLGLKALVDEICKPEFEDEKISSLLINRMLAELDKKISKQVDQILHNEEFQELESTWRSLKYLVDNTDFRENIKVNILNATKDELVEDFEDVPEITKSALYKLVYTGEYGQFGGQPYASIVGNYSFTQSAIDIGLLENIASISAMSHAPFLSSVAPEFFGIDCFTKLPNLNDLSSIFEMPQYTQWNSFRESENSRYVGLTCPKFLLRLPYSEDTVKTKSFDYTEDVSESHNKFLWGNSCFTLASRAHDSFAKYRWAANIIGPKGGGAVENLPIYNFKSLGQTQTKIPTEVLISERREYELSELGFISLGMRKGSDSAVFFSANSCQKPKVFPNTDEGREAETNYKLGGQLPYLFIISRLSHYIKVLQRENVGSWKEKSDLEKGLNDWINQYVVNMENPLADVKNRCPLREAHIGVASVEGEPGWYRVKLSIKPHFKYMGASFTLSLVGKLDKQ
ncbi:MULTISPECIES: type VI secretion system contractile sheath large subunit [unclassified Francisella]|uniref:type VI secretion system contractile sheath large subunit n=1 Tax=unclassified Francisella TaxID=2610885 RepID=UPI002E319BB7|nr:MULTISPECIES: type VI secretion system contractile sheath large subunit [unclassified Francisella]MED7818331.1 type VI secretion system contractile sheath large subunit [Francisella sp. 19S2-4]MED7829167.1 type VI secretion system contractile sheath large subunit [Francisella sp. 19S2-10]